MLTQKTNEDFNKKKPDRDDFIEEKQGDKLGKRRVTSANKSKIIKTKDENRKRAK